MAFKSFYLLMNYSKGDQSSRIINLLNGLWRFAGNNNAKDCVS